MPRPKMLPTPASSAEIKGQDHSSKLSSLQVTFELPPSAIPSTDVSHLPSSGTKGSPVSSPLKQPYLQPSETVKARRRTANTQQQQQKEAFSLPPPPTRSRRIIQMKPRSQEDDEVQQTSTHVKGASNGAANNTAKSGAGRGATSSKPTTTAKRQPSATSVAGRKIARKTAHSLIERRRRSKMNEEFAVLKALIPACTGEMHKLAILQASIEYVRYLEDCIAKLKAQCEQDTSTGTAALTPTVQFRFTRQEPYGDGDWHKQTEGEGEAEAEAEEEEEADEDGDVEMTENSEPSSPVLTEAPVSRSNQSSVSPALLAQDAQTQTPTQHQDPSYLPDYRRRYGVNATANRETPPAVASKSNYPYPPQGTTLGLSRPSLTSPTLRPQLEIDHEVSAALLMLGSDRRGPGSHPVSARGMSVRDLLIS